MRAGAPRARSQRGAARDPGHVRSRYYLAGQATEAGDYERAVTLWTELLALSEGGEPWLEAAQGGLELATAGLAGDVPATPDTAAIEGMVEGLAARLAGDGGSIEDWTRLVRGRRRGRPPGPAPPPGAGARGPPRDRRARTELDVLAADNGLIAKEAEN